MSALGGAGVSPGVGGAGVSPGGGQVSALGGGQEEGPGIRPVNCHITCSRGGGCLELGAMRSRGPSEVVRHGSLCGGRPATCPPGAGVASCSDLRAAGSLGSGLGSPRRSRRRGDCVPGRAPRGSRSATKVTGHGCCDGVYSPQVSLSSDSPVTMTLVWVPMNQGRRAQAVLADGSAHEAGVSRWKSPAGVRMAQGTGDLTVRGRRGQAVCPGRG